MSVGRGGLPQEQERKTFFKGLKVYNSGVRKCWLATVGCWAFIALPAYAQNLTSVETLTRSLLDTQSAGFNLSRNTSSGGYVDEAVNNLNLGLLFSPAKGVDLRADAWHIEIDEQFAATAVMPETLIAAAGNNTKLFIDDSAQYIGMLESPSVKSSLSPGQSAQGLDLSASYVWESPRFGQFIISTKATYLYDSGATTNMLLDGRQQTLSENSYLPKGAELQSSLMLTWQVGKHTASAVTHYFDSFDELGKLDIEQLNELVGSLTTLDLQYGYNLKAGKQGEALFSVGVRNLLDTKPDVTSSFRGVAIEQNGRVAYGSIKYQF
jgi:outer membrane receptor protein involved in Fe transport